MAVGRSDGGDRSKTEEVWPQTYGTVQRDRWTAEIGLDRCQAIEERRLAHRFAAARMPDDQNAVQSSFTVERMSRRRKPDAELFEML